MVRYELESFGRVTVGHFFTLFFNIIKMHPVYILSTKNTTLSPTTASIEEYAN